MALQHESLFGAPIRVGGRVVRLAGLSDIDGVMALRSRAFRAGAEDRDDFDADSLHLWVGPEDGSAPEATLRLRRHASGPALLAGYAAGLYDLAAMAQAGGETLELGRLCTEPGAGDADLLRLLWAGVARLALQTGAARLIGCTSFSGTDVMALDPAWAYLSARHQPPEALSPGRKAPETHGFDRVQGEASVEGQAMLPPLLRAYLSMGGWVSDHAVVDRDLNTCHVFTCVEIDKMPPARRRVMAQMAGM
ncbi:GNAT family N-acetyltransferase [Cereibacter sphaeroides]|nr:GNAT family N-acetyltransferase [Cereibacter sphaeroides]